MEPTSIKWSLLISDHPADYVAENPTENGHSELIISEPDYHKYRKQVEAGQNLILLNSISFVADCVISGRKI